MSVTAMSWAWKTDLPPTDKYLLVALCDHANDEDYTCYPSLTHLSKKTGLNRASVWKILERLVELGLLERAGTHKRNTLYRVVVGSCPKQLVAQGIQLPKATSCPGHTEMVAQGNYDGCPGHTEMVAQGNPKSSYKPSTTISEPSLCAEPLVSAPIITLTLNDKSEFPVTQNQLLEFQELYPGIDVAQQLRNMRGWLISNPTKRKTKTGILRFVTAWLAREQDRGRSPPGQGPPGKPGKINQAIEAFKRAGMLPDDTSKRSDAGTDKNAGTEPRLLAKSR